MKTLITLILFSLFFLTSCGKVADSDTNNPASNIEIGNKTITIITGSSVQSIR